MLDGYGIGEFKITLFFEGFYYGRFDIRTSNVDEFMRGRAYHVLEANGVTSEATHIYDPENSLVDAYRVLFEQWRLAFAIGKKNHENGAGVSGVFALLKLLGNHRS